MSKNVSMTTGSIDSRRFAALVEFLPHDALVYGAKRGLAIECCLSVCPYVRPFVCLSLTLVDHDLIG